MSAQHIHAWLKGPRPFAVGVELIKRYEAPDESILFLLDLGETSVSREVLERALQKLHQEHLQHAKEVQVRNMAPVQVTKADIAAERTRMVRDPRTDGYADAKLPAQLQELYDQVKRDLREMDYYRHRLEQLASDDDRLRDALIIVQLDEQVASAYSRLDAFKATGNDPGESAPTAPPATRNAVDLVRRLKTIESYLSRARSGSRNVSPAKLQLWNTEREELKKLIDALPQG